VLFARMRRGSANTARGIVRFVDELAANLAHEIKSYIGITADVRVVDIGNIERSIGKATRIKEKRD